MENNSCFATFLKASIAVFCLIAALAGAKCLSELYDTRLRKKYYDV